MTKKKQRPRFNMNESLVSYRNLSTHLVENLQPSELIDFISETVFWAYQGGFPDKEIERLIKELEETKDGVI